MASVPRKLWARLKGTSPVTPTARSRTLFYDANSLHGNAQRAPSRSRRMAEVSTLRSDSLTPNDFLDASGKKVLLFHTRTGNSPLMYYHYHSSKQHVRFPTNAHGFLYYHTDPTLAPIAGEIRFRLTANNDPLSFQNGTDLSRPSKRPWSMSLLGLCALHSNAPLKQQLLDDGLVDPALMSKCEQLVKDHGWKRTSQVTLYAMHQPFLIDVSSQAFHIRVVGDDRIGRCKVRSILGDRDGQSPYTGQALVRFEESPLPKHAGRSVLVLRVLKITEPIKGDHHFIHKPKEGSLLQTNRTLRFFYIYNTRSDPQHPILKSEMKDFRLLLPISKK